MAQYEPGLYLNDVLATETTEYSETFSIHWGLNALEPPEWLDRASWNLARLVDLISIQLFASARALEAPQDPESFVATVRGLEKVLGQSARDIEFVKQRLEIELAREDIDRLAEVRSRIFDLMELLVQTPNPRARGYLFRVSECYLRGMTTEGLVMCRAVLDAALHDYIPDETVREAKIIKNGRVMLGHRVELLKRRALLSSEILEAIQRVKDAGDHAVHTAPNAIGDLKGRITDLSAGLTALANLSS